MAHDKQQSAQPDLKRIMVAVDTSAASAATLAYLRKIVPAGAALRILSVVENPRALMPMRAWHKLERDAAFDELRRDAAQTVEAARSLLADRQVEVDAYVVDLSAREGDVAHTLADAAARWPADLLVVGTRHHRGLLRWIEGTVSGSLAALFCRPVLIVPDGYDAGDDSGLARVLFATDGSGASNAAMRFGAQLAAPGAQLRAIHVIDGAPGEIDPATMPGAGEAFEEHDSAALADARQILDGPGRAVVTGLVPAAGARGDVARTLVQEATHWGAQLVVLGTHGRGAAGTVLGSVAEHAVKAMPVPLLLVPS